MNIKAPLVVGYKGEIGSFILQGLLRTMSKALNIWCFDVNERTAERIQRIQKADVIFLCVPVEKTVDWLHRYRKIIKGKIIIEQSSLKGMLKEQAADKSFTLLSMHMLFRPSATPEPADRRIVLIGHKAWDTYVRDIEEITQARVVWTTDYRKHDIAMAYQQALLHRVILTLGETLRGLPGQTYVGHRIMELDTRIRKGNKDMYRFIQGNRYLRIVLKEFNKNLRKFSL